MTCLRRTTAWQARRRGPIEIRSLPANASPARTSLLPSQLRQSGRRLASPWRVCLLADVASSDVDHSHCQVLAPATLAALPSTARFPIATCSMPAAPSCHVVVLTKMEVFAEADRSTRLAAFPPKSDSQLLRQCDGKILQTRNRLQKCSRESLGKNENLLPKQPDHYENI